MLDHEPFYHVVVGCPNQRNAFGEVLLYLFYVNILHKYPGPLPCLSQGCETFKGFELACVCCRTIHVWILPTLSSLCAEFGRLGKFVYFRTAWIQVYPTMIWRKFHSVALCLPGSSSGWYWETHVSTNCPSAVQGISMLIDIKGRAAYEGHVKTHVPCTDVYFS
jgi:hypothetical protein